MTTVAAFWLGLNELPFMKTPKIELAWHTVGVLTGVSFLSLLLWD